MNATRVSVVLLIGLLTMGAKHGYAEPVTFRYEAEIFSILNADTFDPGLSISVGDIISGRFTYAPDPGVDNILSITRQQTHKFTIEIDGTPLRSPSFELQAVNNTVVTHLPPTNTADVMSLVGFGFAPLAPGKLPTLDTASSSFSVSLLGPIETVPRPSFPTEVDVLNNFTYRRSLSIGLDGVGLNGAGIGINAQIGMFVAVPEPSTAFLFTSIFSVFGFCRCA